MKLTKFKTAATALALSVALSGIASAATLKLSHVRPQGTAIDLDAKKFAEDVNAATNGKVKVKIYAASALGNYTTVQERISVGAVDMAVQPPSASGDKRFQIVYFPYLTKDWTQAKKTYRPGSPLRNAISDLYAKQDIKVLAAWPGYFGGFALNKEANKMSEPGVDKGVKIRAPGMKSFQLMAEKMGFIPAPIPFSEAFTAVQTGVVDGVVGSGAEGYYASFRDVTKYYIPMNTHFEMWYLIINAGTFADLSDEEKMGLEKASAEFEARRWETAESDQAANEKKLADYGAKIVPVSDAQRDKLQSLVRKEVWPVIVNDVGKEWGQKTLDAILSE